LVAIIVCGSICGCTRDILFSIAGQRVVLRLRKRLFNHMLAQDVAFFGRWHVHPCAFALALNVGLVWIGLVWFGGVWCRQDEER
jgi:ABC-type multidrug transport system fused ATPase/permease subunit